MIPQSLQNLKERAASVESERRDVAAEDDCAWWQKLVEVARANLGEEVWSFVAQDRPRTFSAQTDEYCFAVCLPGHREIYARFTAWEYQLQPRGQWARRPFSGSPSDLPDGQGYWMINNRRHAQLPTYTHTLGAALLAAERE